MDIEKRASKERRRLKKLLGSGGVNEHRIKALSEVLTNCSWMKAKLDDARELIADQSITVAYDNGGGQTGIRINPAFQAYEQLWKSYMAGLSKILESLPDDQRASAIPAEAEPQNVLEIIRARRRT